MHPFSIDATVPRRGSSFKLITMGRHRFITVLLFAVLGFAGFAARAQEYHGPPPPKADVPYLLHAANLIETEVAQATKEVRRKVTAYVVPGVASPVRTPLAEPIFIFLSDHIAPNQLQLFPMKVVHGHREVAFPKKRNKRGPRPRYLSLKSLGKNLYWIEANEYLDNGEYCLTPEGSNQSFCFEIY